MKEYTPQQIAEAKKTVSKLDSSADTIVRLIVKDVDDTTELLTLITMALADYYNHTTNIPLEKYLEVIELMPGGVRYALSNQAGEVQ